jgi:hypothetical protein
LDIGEDIPRKPATCLKNGKVSLRQNQFALPAGQVQPHCNGLSGRLRFNETLQHGRIHTLTLPHGLDHQFNLTATGQPDSESIRIGNPVAQASALPRLQCLKSLQDHRAFNAAA